MVYFKQSIEVEEDASDNESNYIPDLHVFMTSYLICTSKYSYFKSLIQQQMPNSVWGPCPFLTVT